MFGLGNAEQRMIARSVQDREAGHKSAQRPDQLKERTQIEPRPCRIRAGHKALNLAIKPPAAPSTKAKQAAARGSWKKASGKARKL